MRIVLDVSPLSHPRTGIGNYLQGMIGGLARVGAERHELVAFAPTSLRGPGRIRHALAPTVVSARLWPVPWSHALRTAWSRLGHPAAERLLGSFDALLYTDWMYPPQRAGLRTTIVHDLVPVHHPEWCTPRTVSMHTHKYENAARTCDVIFTNSHHTAADVSDTLGVGADRIVVAQPGLGPGFTPAGDRYDAGRPYVLGVGTLEPRKNLGALVEAWRLLESELGLVLVGDTGWGEIAALDDPGITRLGYVPDTMLPALYRGAAAFVYPSRVEGFGIPILEAMACGTPVVASAHASMDEAAGVVAVRADPERPESIADAIGEAIARRETLVPAGLEHAAGFTWDATAAVMLQALEERA
jgi:glycosyltransferase involved in cell wall biosynthesis